MSTLVEAKNDTIYRYKFSTEVQDKLAKFVKTHKLDDVNVFREFWDDWVLDNSITILEEGRRLHNLGYRGDATIKMYKSVRYYYKDKSDKKVEAKKRRIYIALDRDILDAMDGHIKKNKTMKPSVAYLSFLGGQNEKILIDKTVTTIIHSGLDKAAAEFKLKKTYKNRFFLRK